MIEQLNQQPTDTVAELLKQANLIIEHSPVVLFQWGAEEDWPVISVSRNIRQYGYALDEFLNGPISFKSLIHPEDLERVEREIGGYSAIGVDEFEQEYRFLTREKQIRWIESRTTIARDAEDEAASYQAVIIDRTDQKREEELAQARDQALEANRMKSRFLASVSHDLRTPLNAILGYAEMLREGIYGEISDDQRQATQKIIDNTSDLTTLVNGLLDQAQLEAGILRLELRPFEPRQLIEHIESTMKLMAEQKGLELTHEVDLDKTLLGDLNRLGQVLSNLVGNAIKFTKKGSIQIRIFQSDQIYWAIQVIDTGIGIPTKEQSLIFEPFHQVERTTIDRKEGGSGLGLSIVKQLVTLMGGEITLESKLGHGSTFTVLLPIQEAA